MPAATLVAAALMAAQTQTMVIPATPLPKQPEAAPAHPKNADSPEEIAKDAARDLKDSRFYNKPGATRAEYDAAWQECRLIARGSRTPTGAIPYTYNPALVSPVAAGIGAGLGAALAGAIMEGAQRRANRRSCLLVRGWRLVEVDGAEAARVQAMTDEQRSAYLNTIVGAADVKGAKITSWNNDYAAPRLAPESAQ